MNNLHEKLTKAIGKEQVFTDDLYLGPAHAPPGGKRSA